MNFEYVWWAIKRPFLHLGRFGIGAAITILPFLASRVFEGAPFRIFIAGLVILSFLSGALVLGYILESLPKLNEPLPKWQLISNLALGVQALFVFILFLIPFMATALLFVFAKITFLGVLALALLVLAIYFSPSALVAFALTHDVILALKTGIKTALTISYFGYWLMGLVWSAFLGTAFTIAGIALERNIVLPIFNGAASFAVNVTFFTLIGMAYVKST